MINSSELRRNSLMKCFKLQNFSDFHYIFPLINDLVYVNIDQDINQKYATKHMANFEAFVQNIQLSINLLFLKSEFMMILYISFQMFLYYAFPMLFDTLRSLMGPFPRPICKLSVFIKNVSSINVALMSIALSFTKVLFVFYYKTIPVMEDNFWARFIYMTCSMVSMLASFSRLYLPGRPILNEV